MVDMLRQMPVDLEPKRQNRWVLEFPNGINIESWQVQTAGAPKMTINKTEVPYINTTDFVAGKYIWDALTFTFIDPITPSSSQGIMEWVRQHAETATGRMGYASQYKKELILKMLDPAGQEVSKWVLEGCMIENVDFGDLDYGSDDLTNISVTVQPARCILEY
jgi:hypothetical protein